MKMFYISPNIFGLSTTVLEYRGPQRIHRFIINKLTGIRNHVAGTEALLLNLSDIYGEGVE